MRQRNIKNLEEKIEKNSTYRIASPGEWRGRWNEAFRREAPLFLEIGCGKGKFLMEMAERNPGFNFIGIEGQGNVILRALEKAEELGQENLRLFQAYVHDLGDYFEKDELDGIYLNFSDPWPKARHAKRRLTYRNRLANYFSLLKEDGFVEFKTDNDALFAFTLEEMEEAGLTAEELTRDLHGENSIFASRLVMTEYEERFCGRGKNINYVKMKKKNSLR